MTARCITPSLFGPVIDMPPIHLVRDAGDNRSICGIKNPNPVTLNRPLPNLHPTFTICPKCKAAA